MKLKLCMQTIANTSASTLLEKLFGRLNSFRAVLQSNHTFIKNIIIPILVLPFSGMSFQTLAPMRRNPAPLMANTLALQVSAVT